MTSIAPIATQNSLTHYCYQARHTLLAPELATAYVTGTPSAERARGFMLAGGSMRRVVELLIDAVSTSVTRTAMGDHLLSCAAGLLEGSVTPSAELDALCEDEVSGTSSASAAPQAVIVGCLIDVALGRLDDVDGAEQLTQQVAMIAPFVDADGHATKRGKVLANALRALSAQ